MTTLPPLPELEPWAKCMVIREDVARALMREYGALCRREALEEAMRICEDLPASYEESQALDQAYKAIEELLK